MIDIPVKNIIFIGAGNAATHLALAFAEAGYNILQVYSRTEESAKALAEKVASAPIAALNTINQDADVYVIAVNDDEIINVAKRLQLPDKLVVHTSGSAPLNVLRNTSVNHGVFWPVQTFTKERKINFRNVPVCIEASNRQSRQMLELLAGSVSGFVHLANDEQRKIIHAAAVFACNFSNHMYAIAGKILSSQGLPFDILKPLILETAGKIIEQSPEHTQTGPAVRGDQKTMDEHLHLLENSPVYQKIYTLVSQSIKENNSNE